METHFDEKKDTNLWKERYIGTYLLDSNELEGRGKENPVEYVLIHRFANICGSRRNQTVALAAMKLAHPNGRLRRE